SRCRNFVNKCAAGGRAPSPAGDPRSPLARGGEVLVSTSNRPGGRLRTRGPPSDFAIFSFSSPCDIVRPMSPQPLHYDFAHQLHASQEFFARSTRVLDEADSGFRPREGMMTVAQQVAHTAQTLDWFIEGATRPEGFDLDMEKLAKDIEAVTSLAAARQML